MMRWVPVFVLAWASNAFAHHSFANVYDTNRSITLEGVVNEFQFVHPHPILVIRVAPDQSWRAEMDNRFELEDIGITGQTFRPGDRVRFSGSPGRAQNARILYLWKLERPADGLRYEQVGSTPTLRQPSRN